MANKKQTYKWNLVKPGDIVSFKYKSMSTGRRLTHAILVLNPKLNVKLKDGTTTQHLIGIKLEESNKIVLRITGRQVKVLEKLGELRKIDDENNLYRLIIKENLVLNNIRGIKKSAFKLISQSLNIRGSYRTYDYRRAKKSSVYLEPIRIFTDENKL
tara:strand:- start:119 stop:589 length:471 start_codon:yes stop_codon:yes gene_type:complete